MPNNKISYGLSNCHYSIATQNATTGEWTFATPVAIPGAQEFSSDIVGGSTSVYADDVIYHTITQNAGRTLTLKLTEISDTFKTDLLGYQSCQNGNLVEIANVKPVTFALGFELQGDAKARRCWFYLCTITPISESTKSKADSVEANAVTLNITARPIEVGDKLVTCVVSNAGDTNYTNFLTTAPTLPTL